MKKSFLALASFAAIAVGCQVEKMNDELPLVDDAVVYKAVTEAYAPATKTAMDGLDVVWSAGDNIAVYQTMAPAKFVVTSESAGKTAAKFTLVTAAEEGYDAIDANVAVYPYSSELFVVPEMDMDENFDMVPTGLYKLQGYEVPSTQTYAPNSFGNGAFPMVALNENVEDRTFEFKNILGAVKLQLTGTKTVKSIKFEGNSGEYLAGMPQQIVFGADETPEIVWSMYGDPAESTVTLDCGEGVELDSDKATDFVLAMAPTYFEAGFTVTIFTTDGGSYQIKTTKEQTVDRSKVLAMTPKNIDEYALGVSVKSTPSLTDAILEINVDRDDATGFYGIFVPVENWPQIKMYLDYNYFTFVQLLQGAMGTEVPSRFYGKEFTGKLSEFGVSDMYIEAEMCNWIQPNKSYYVIVVPGNELPAAGGGEEDDLGGVAPLALDDEGGESSVETYTLSDAIFFEVSTCGFTTGGTLELPSYEVEEGYTGSLVTFDGSDDVAYMMYEIFTKGSELPTETNYIEKLTSDPLYSSAFGTEINVDNDYNVLPGTEYVLCVLVADEQGKTSFHTIDVATTPIPYDETLEVTITNLEYENGEGENEVWATVTYPENTDKLYYQVNNSASYTEYNAATSIVDMLEGYSSWNEATLTDGETSVDVSAVAVGNNWAAKNNYVHVVVISSEGKVSKLVTSSAINCPKKN